MLSDGTWTYTWEQGRQLKAMTDGTTNLSFSYDEEGKRVSKTVGNTTWKHVYNGSNLVYMTDGTNYLYFHYDATGASGFTYNNTPYYYLKNAQGDVIGIADETGYVIAEYSYDAWGNPVTITDTSLNAIGQLNPIRYRGYYYDTETGLYYLMSRYYDPEMGRFINADKVAFLGANGEFISYNLFAYGLNNPVNNTDDGGTFSLPNWAKIAIGVGIIAAAAAITIATAGAATGVLAAVNCAAHGAMVGAATQGALGAIEGAATGAVMHRITTGSWEGAGQAALDGAADGFLSGTIEGAINGAINSPYCFIAGTVILTELGKTAIEEIKESDKVWAWDEETGEKGLKEVVETYVNETEELVHVFINDEEIVTTPSHPFYRPNHGWTDAIDLRAGDKLVTVNGEYVVVEMVQHEILEEPIKVYNFQVEDYHTYYVSDEDVLVHNSCNHDKKWASERRKHWRDQGQFYKDKIDKTAMSDNNLFPLTEENVNRMLRGSAPIGKDGKSVVLHHRQGIKNNFDDYIEMLATDHTTNFKDHHKFLYK